MTYIKELQKKIEDLADGFDMKSIEMVLLENEMHDMLRPNILLSQLNQFVIQMLMELNEYQQKNKLTERMKASKERLLKMLDITIELSGLGDKAQSFKLHNKHMVGKITQLRIKNQELQRKMAILERTCQDL